MNPMTNDKTELWIVKQVLSDHGIRDWGLHDALDRRGYNPYCESDVIEGGKEIVRQEILQ